MLVSTISNYCTVHIILLTCPDTNECANNNGSCAQNCHNTVGSYYCTCNTGYTLSSDGHACNGEYIVTLCTSCDLCRTDNDECALDTHLCHHVCINTIGSYICDCNVGYMLNSDGLTCSGMYTNTCHVIQYQVTHYHCRY